MLVIPGQSGHTCDGPTRREFLRVGSLGIFGISLSQTLALRDAHAATAAVDTFAGGKGFGSAKSVILLFLQGGPSHIDIWDPKPDAPSNIRGEFGAIDTKVDGIRLSETMPMLAEQVDKCTLIRSMSYTPKGLFNHTAAIYQMLTGYPPDRVSPSGQLEPPTPADFPTAGSHVSRLRPLDDAMLPFVEMPRPLQESNVIGKGGAAGFLGKAYDALDEYYEKAYDLVLSGKARQAFDLSNESDETRERYGKNTFGQGALMARRLIEAGTRFVQLNWPAVANGNPEVDSWDTHAANFAPLKNLHCPVLDRALSALLSDMDDRGLLDETLVVAVGEFGRSPRLGVSTSGNSNSPDGRDHWPYCYTALVAGAGVSRGQLYGESDETGSAPREKPVHPNDLLATVYHTLGIDPAMEILNHLDQPRELVKGEVIRGLWA